MTIRTRDRCSSAASGHLVSSNNSSSSSVYGKSWRSYSNCSDYSDRPLQPLESGAESIDSAQFSGWLWMRRSKLRRWRQRYFILNGAMLSFFNSFPSESFLRQHSKATLPDSAVVYHLTDDAQPLGVLRVAHVDECCHLGFKVFGTSGKSIEVRAQRLDTRNEWLRMLKSPARRKSRSWSAGAAEEITMSMSSFDPADLTYVCPTGRQSIPIAKSGWMLKKSDVLKRWNRYFFVVQGKMLSYYASEKPYEVPRRRGYVQGVQVVRHMGTSGLQEQQELQIRLESQSQVLHVRLSCEEDLEDWRDMLLDAAR